MTVPNVCISWCHRRAECKWCDQNIEAGDPIVTVFFWNKGADNHKWNTKLYYHPQCWVDQGLDYLKMNPYVKHERWKLKLSEEDRKLRYILLRRKCSLDQRRRNLKSDYPDRVLMEARLDSQVAELMIEMLKVGGIPKKWVNTE